MKEIHEIVSPMKSAVVQAASFVFQKQEWNELEQLLDQYFDPTLDMFVFHRN